MKFLALALLAVQASAFSINGPAKAKTALGLSSNFGDPAKAGIDTGASVGPGGQGGLSLKKSASGPPRATSTRRSTQASTFDIWETASPSIVQGGSLRTWSCAPGVERVQVLMKTDGRPCNANIELWQGPDNTPQKMTVYLEDGETRPFSAIVETPREGSNTVAIYNTATIEYPLYACVEGDMNDSADLMALSANLENMSAPRTVQGGSVHTFPFSHEVASVQVLLKTDGRPLNARIELMQGPNNNKQVMEVYTEDGMERPFFMVIEAPGSENVVRLINTATVEFPLTARVEPYLVETSSGRPSVSGGSLTPF